MSAARLEICLEDATHCAIAEAGGADRIELCANLAVGGVSPDPAAMQAARTTCTLPIMAMVRPRGGDFRYDEAECRAMEAQIDAARDSGMNGVVLGVLNEQGQIDQRLLERLIVRARGLDVTFHRAFDETPDAEAALELLIAAGVTRVLTSGHAATAMEGSANLARLIETAAGRLIVLPGGGVRATNAAALLRDTGAVELHSSAGFPAAPTEDAVRAIVRAMSGPTT